MPDAPRPASSPSRSPLVSPTAWACFLLTAVVGLSVDLWTKHEAFARLAVPIVRADGGVDYRPAGRHEFIPGFLHFQITSNHGAVFGLGQGGRVWFLAVSVVAVGFLTYLFANSGRRWFYQVLLGMLLGGVLGNLYDRAVYGYVRDMIHALPAWGVFPWIFNVADSLLCVGVALLLLYNLVYPGEVHHGEYGEAVEDEEAKRALKQTP